MAERKPVPRIRGNLPPLDESKSDEYGRELPARPMEWYQRANPASNNEGSYASHPWSPPEVVPGRRDRGLTREDLQRLHRENPEYYGPVMDDGGAVPRSPLGYPTPEPREPLEIPIGRGTLQVSPEYVPEQIMRGTARYELPVGKKGWSVGAEGEVERYIGPGYETVPITGGGRAIVRKKFQQGGRVGPKGKAILNKRYRAGGAVKDDPTNPGTEEWLQGIEYEDHPDNRGERVTPVPAGDDLLAGAVNEAHQRDRRDFMANNPPLDLDDDEQIRRMGKPVGEAYRERGEADRHQKKLRGYRGGGLITLPSPGGLKKPRLPSVMTGRITRSGGLP